MQELIPYDPELIDPEFLLDDYHPANDRFLLQQELIQKKIMAQSACMSPQHVQAVKYHVTGMSNTDIAEKLNLHPSTISQAIKGEKGKRLAALLHFYQAGIEGPNKAQRKNLLWRMAVKNEDERPTVAKECVAELNKMDKLEHDIEFGKQGNNNQVNIFINQEQLPKGALDG